MTFHHTTRSTVNAQFSVQKSVLMYGPMVRVRDPPLPIYGPSITSSILPVGHIRVHRHVPRGAHAHVSRVLGVHGAGPALHLRGPATHAGPLRVPVREWVPGEATAGHRKHLHGAVVLVWEESEE